MPAKPFSPEVKTHMITNFLNLPETVLIPSHTTAFKWAENKYRHWVHDQHKKEHNQWLDGCMYGACNCGHVYENDTDHSHGHGTSCPFSGNRDHQTPARQTRT